MTEKKHISVIAKNKVRLTIPDGVYSLEEAQAIASEIIALVAWERLSGNMYLTPPPKLTIVPDE